MIAVIDYGMSNMYSVIKALQALNVKCDLVNTPEAMNDYDKVILPGVGAFGNGMKALKESGLFEAIRNFATTGRPLLGICLGMQFMFDGSEEHGWNDGLGLISGKVVSINFGREKVKKVPHIAWRKLYPFGTWRNTILRKCNGDDEFYFLHSYMVIPENREEILATVAYGETEIIAFVRRDNIYGSQPHIEKSRESGLKVLMEFANM